MFSTVLGLSSADQTTVLLAAGTAFVTMLATLPLRWFLAARLNRDRERTRWEFEQRRELRKTIGEFHGRLIETAASFNYRLVNLDENWPLGRHDVSGALDAPADKQHYLHSLVYRFLLVQGLVTDFQREAMFIDSRIGKREDRTFLFFLKAMQWALTGEKLFAPLEYDASTEAEHFFTDHLQRMTGQVWKDGEPLEWDDFVTSIQQGGEGTAVLQFFDGIRPGELRWDRLRAYRLVLMAFVNTFGYGMQRSPRKWLKAVADDIEHPEVAANLYRWLPKFGLRYQWWILVLRKALKSRARQSPQGRRLLKQKFDVVRSSQPALPASKPSR